LKVTSTSAGFLQKLHPKKFFFRRWIFFPREPD